MKERHDRPTLRRSAVLLAVGASLAMLEGCDFDFGDDDEPDEPAGPGQRG
jgi:hypothetical protein